MRVNLFRLVATGRFPALFLELPTSSMGSPAFMNLPVSGSLGSLAASAFPLAILFLLFLRGGTTGGPYVNSNPQLGHWIALTVLGPFLNVFVLLAVAMQIAEN